LHGLGFIEIGDTASSGETLASREYSTEETMSGVHAMVDSGAELCREVRDPAIANMKFNGSLFRVGTPPARE